MTSLRPKLPTERWQTVSRAGAAGVTLLLFLCLGAAGCGGLVPGEREAQEDPGTDPTMPPMPPRIVPGLRIVPDNDVLLVDLNQTATKNFSVFLVSADGTRMDVTSQAALSSDNTTVGQVAGNIFTSAKLTTNKVDFTHVRANLNGMSATANLTVVWLRQSGPSQDFYFELPYQGNQKSQPLTFQTFIQSIDAFFAVDTTGSMAGEINNLHNSLSGTIIPAVKKAAVKDAWFGVGAVEDFHQTPYGNAGSGMDDQPFILLSAMNAAVNVAQQAVDKLMNGGAPRGQGGDTPEGQMEALYQIATGEGNVKPKYVNIPPHQITGTRGGVEFRAGAFPVVVMITDAVFHAKGEARACGGEQIDYGGDVKTAAHTRAETVAALNKSCAKVIGLAAEDGGTGACIPSADLTQFAQATGAMVGPEAWGTTKRPAGCAADKCCTGHNGAGVPTDASGLCPLVFKIRTDGSGLGDQLVSGITNLAQYASFDVVTNKSGTTSGENGAVVEMGHTTADFIKTITPLDATASPPPTSKTPMKTADGFTGVVPGAVVRFNISAQNDFQRPSLMPQVFHATIKVLAGGCTDLDQRDVIIVVPPTPPPIG